MRVTILGGGKVGRALARALRAGGQKVALRPMSKGLPSRPLVADLLILAVRDTTLVAVAGELAAAELTSGIAAVVHCAGSLGPEALHPLSAAGRGVGQLHPLVSLADGRGSLAGAHALVTGDPAAVRLARRAARAAGLRPVTIEGLDRTLYHAAAALLANGSAALAAVACDVLVQAGCPEALAPRLLGPLLGSVADNLGRLGAPRVLTGPVRRGDAVAVAAHLDALRAGGPDVIRLYLALAKAQIPLAKALGEASRDGLEDIARSLEKA